MTGASGGLGRQVSLRLARSRYLLFLQGRDIARLEALASEIEQLGAVRPHVFQADFANLAAVGELCSRIEGRTERLDLLVNNAGCGFEADDPLTADGHRRSFQVNYLSPYLLMHRLLPLMRRAEESMIVNVASLGQADLPESMSEVAKASPAIAYGRSKLALLMATRSLADELGAGPPRLFAVHPGSMLDTDLTHRLLEKMPGWVGRGWRLTRRFRPTVEEAADFVTSFATHVAGARKSGTFWTARGPGRTRRQFDDPGARDRLEAFSRLAVGRFLSAAPRGFAPRRAEAAALQATPI